MNTKFYTNVGISFALHSLLNKAPDISQDKIFFIRFFSWMRIETANLLLMFLTEQCPNDHRHRKH